MSTRLTNGRRRQGLRVPVEQGSTAVLLELAPPAPSDRFLAPARSRNDQTVISRDEIVMTVPPEGGQPKAAPAPRVHARSRIPVGSGGHGARGSFRVSNIAPAPLSNPAIAAITAIPGPIVAPTRWPDCSYAKIGSPAISHRSEGAPCMASTSPAIRKPVSSSNRTTKNPMPQTLDERHAVLHRPLADRQRWKDRGTL